MNISSMQMVWSYSRAPTLYIHRSPRKRERKLLFRWYKGREKVSNFSCIVIEREVHIILLHTETDTLFSLVGREKEKFSHFLFIAGGA